MTNAGYALNARLSITTGFSPYVDFCLCECLIYSIFCLFQTPIHPSIIASIMCGIGGLLPNKPPVRCPFTRTDRQPFALTLELELPVSFMCLWIAAGEPVPLGEPTQTERENIANSAQRGLLHRKSMPRPSSLRGRQCKRPKMNN